MEKDKAIEALIPLKGFMEELLQGVSLDTLNLEDWAIGLHNWSGEPDNMIAALELAIAKLR